MKYKFNLGDKVSIRGSEDKGEVFSRRFSLMSLTHMNFLPTKYYVVMLQDEYSLDGKTKETMDGVKVEFFQKHLEKI
jgi:hypothetical protein